MADSFAAIAAAASVRPRIRRAIKNSEIAVMPKRMNGKVNSGNRETARLNAWQRYRRTRMKPSKVDVHQRAAIEAMRSKGSPRFALRTVVRPIMIWVDDLFEVLLD